MKIKCWTNTPKTGENRTHLKNDTLIFDNEKSFTMNRIPVKYMPNTPKSET